MRSKIVKIVKYLNCTKLVKNIIFFFLFIFICSCAQKIIDSKIPVQVDQGKFLFDKACKYYNSERYLQALKYYNRYLDIFPNGSKVDIALFKKGYIYIYLDKINKARDVYEQLIKRYPNSSFVSDAVLKITELLYAKGNYDEVIKDVNKLLPKITFSDLKTKIIIIKADAQIMLNLLLDSFFSYMDAYKMSLTKDKRDEKEKRKIYNKILSVINNLDQKQIVFLVNQIDNNEIIGDLLFQLGLIYLEKGDDKMAQETFIQITQSKYASEKQIDNVKKQIHMLQKKDSINTFKIGCLLPLSGKYKIAGNKALKGIETAMAYFSTVEKQPIFKIIVKDTKANPEIAKLSVIQLVEEGVSIIIGPIITAEAAALQAQESRVPLIALTQKEAVCDTGEFIFNNFLTPQMQVQALSSYVINQLDVNRIAILYPDEKYGIMFKNLFWNEVVKLGGEIVGLEEYKAGDTDFADSVKKIVGLYYKIPQYLKHKTELEYNDKDDDKSKSIVDFQAVFIPDSATMVGLMLPQLRFFDIKNVYLLGTNIWHSDSLIEMAGRYLNGAIISEGFFAQSERAVVIKFVENFKTLYEKTPGFIEAVAYDTAMILLNIAVDNNKFSNKSLIEKLQNVINFNGVTGITSFEESGCVSKELSLLTIQDKKFVEISKE